MEFLNNQIKKLKEYKMISTSLNHKGAYACYGLSSVHKANVIASLTKDKKCKSLVITADESHSQTLANDLTAMGLKALVYPIRDLTFSKMSSMSTQYEHNRLGVLLKMISGDFDCVIACLDAVSLYTIPKDVLKDSILTFKSGSQIQMQKIIELLTLAGYERYDQVEGQGQFSVRGGILDFFKPDEKSPVRVEFWGDEIDTVNYFDIETQRRTDYIEEISITPCAEILIKDKTQLIEDIEKVSKALKGRNKGNAQKILQDEMDLIASGIDISNKDKFINLIYKKSATLFDYMGENDLFFISEQDKVLERYRSFAKLQNEEIKYSFQSGVLCKGLDKFNLEEGEIISILSKRKTVFLDIFAKSTGLLPLDALVNFTTKQLSVWSGAYTILKEDLQTSFDKFKTIVILAGTEKTSHNLYEELKKEGFRCTYIEDDLKKVEKNNIYIMPGALSSGFEYPEIDFMLITHGQAQGNYKKKKKSKHDKNAKKIYSLSELVNGDYVVHATHGIGIYRGIHKIEMQDVIKDYIKIEYAKSDELYVPITQLDIVSKYIGNTDSSRTKVHTLGTGEWQKAKKKAKSAVKDMAKQLIALYSQRQKAKGIAFSEDKEWQRDFEAKFEYDETQDQLQCIEEIKGDMEKSMPMERLLCGDVGFGKTEVALRAIFKCVTDFKQCAFLCPTTILAWQHYQTAVRRFDGYPIRIELLSRFKTPKEKEKILEKLKRGEIDLIIGTHSIIQKKVEFYDLGLCVIDEEQRFGVGQKERFKEIANNADILTLSATPIPRTLNMAMSGIRDMSVIEQAPHDRHPVQTYVLEHDSDIIGQAIKKELRRGGQIFYVFNNVENIMLKAAELKRLVPEAEIAVGHGKMQEKELAEVWRRMIENEVQILLCTTIIETGVDIPNANTLIIENADHMGLSQLHQLRGRVGRSSRRAYAYFTYLPQKVLTEISQKRLSAIKEFTQFGSGFKIAMRDLEIRGAGNILGGNQHGHMEDVGYDMYIKLLSQAIAEEKGEKVEEADNGCLVDVHIQAHIPENYISSLSQRIDIYRRIADIKNNEDAMDVQDELLDRFGDIPSSVQGLIKVAIIRSCANALGIYEIRQTGNEFLLFVEHIKNRNLIEFLHENKVYCTLQLTEKPHILVKMYRNMPPLQALQIIFKLK